MIAKYIYLLLAALTLVFCTSYAAVALEQWIRARRNYRAMKRRDDDPPFAF
jgi:hypothetical protein